MRYIVAVSGGIDSVVLLDTLVKTGGHELIVAHFDHGIRKDSASDARFVAELAKKYDCIFETKREELGPGASEELARNRRYAFLRETAARYDAIIITAHHADDVLETIAINLVRGTGWRGLSVMDAKTIVRPLLRYTKHEIYTYALHCRLEWVEDDTNNSNIYLRNRMRQKLSSILPESHRQIILDLWRKQVAIKNDIDEEVSRLVGNTDAYSRYFFTQLDDTSACELLRGVLILETGTGLTRPQTERLLVAIKTARSNTLYELNATTRIRFTLRRFIVETP